MPIRKELRFLYPIDWRELSTQIRFVRVKGRCERCGRPHGQWSGIRATAAGRTRRRISGAAGGLKPTGQQLPGRGGPWGIYSRSLATGPTFRFLSEGDRDAIDGTPLAPVERSVL